MSEEGNFPGIVEGVACGKDLIRERYMGMYPDEDTPKRLYSYDSHPRLAALLHLLPLWAFHEEPAQNSHRYIRSST